MNTTVEQILDALNAEPQRAATSFLTPEDTARLLHEYASSHEHSMRQPIVVAEVHNFAAAFGANLSHQNIVSNPEFDELVQERAELVKDVPMILWGLELDEYGFFCRFLNPQAQQVLREKGDLITFDELLALDPWYLILHKDVTPDVPA